jgi:DNA invertase Pin-like site-specific DNA recombinase
MTKIGYARVSTGEQSTDAQEARLLADGCERVFCDVGQSGAKASRPQWDKCLASLQPGDVLVSVRLDRFGRSVQHLLALAEDLNTRDIGLRCIDQGMIDTTSSMGRLLFGILACVAAFERDLGIERTLDGMANARAAGKQIGAPKSLSDDQERIVVQLHAGGMKPGDIAVMTGSSKRTVYRTLQRAQLAAAG